jgi:hypothetical protein
MTGSNVLESLPDRAMKRSEIEDLGDGDAVEWVEPVRTGTSRERRNMVSAWALQANGTVHVLLYELDGWASQGSFDAEGLTGEQKRERSIEILDS